jgi:uncharacterized protein (DUF1015 family)
VHVDCPVGDLGSGREGVAGGGADPYEEAARTFDRWRADGTLVTDAQPTFTIYRMSFVDEAGVERSTTGALGALTLERPGEGGILPHERTTPKATSDRLDLLRATKANLSAIWGLSLASGLSDLLHPAGDPVADLTDPDGVRHQAWVVDDPTACEAITAAVATAPVVIADGHHRFETSLTYRDEAPADAPGAAATLAYVVELVEEQLTVQPIHRLLDGFPEDFDLAGALAAVYEVTPTASLAPGLLGLVTADATYTLAPRADDGTLDTVRLDEALAGLPEHTLAYQHGVANVLAAVADGRAQAGVLLRPVTVAQIAAVADAADRMPPKTTFFAPKPRTGIVFRSLTEG